MEDKKQGLGRIALKRLSVEAADSAEPFSATDAQLRELSERYQRPALDLSRVRIPLELLDLLPRETAELHALLPVRIKDDALLVAMIEPDNASVLDELSFVTGKRIVPYVAPAADVREAISSAYLAKRRGEKFYEGPRCAIVAAEAPEAPATSGLVGAPDSRFESPTRGAPSVSEPKAVVPPVPPARNVNRATPASAPLEPSSPPATRQSAAMVRPPPDIPDLVVGNIAIREAPRKPSEAFQALDFEDEAGGEKVSLSLSFDNLPAAGAASGRGLSSDQVPAVPHQKGVANGFRVLLVEDDSEIAQLVRRLLEAEGYAVIVAPDGEAALTRLKQEAPHVLLLDAMLPKVHGFEVVRRVRASRRLADLPIVILSAVHRGWGYAEDLRVSSGIQHYIEKPFDTRHLLQVVAQAVRPPGDTLKLDKGAAQELAAGVSALNAGDLEAAQQRLEMALGFDPAAHQIHFQLGVVHGKRGRVFEAIASFERALSLAPRLFAAVRSLAMLYQKAGFANKAKEMWERSLILAPDEPTRESIREHLRRLG